MFVRVAETAWCKESSLALPVWQRETHSTTLYSAVCPQLTSSLVETKHNVDCNMIVSSSAYKRIILASANLANQASSYTGSFFMSCLKVICDSLKAIFAKIPLS